MRKLQLFTILMFNIIVLISCTNSNVTDNNNDSEVGNNDYPNAVANGISAVAQFAFFTVDLLLGTNCSKILNAPLDFFYLISLIALRTKTNTPAYQEVLNFTGMSNKNEIRFALERITAYFDISQAGVYIVSDVIVSDACFTNQYKCDVDKILEGTTRTYDLRNPEAVRRSVNKLISNHSDNHVTNTVPCSDVFKKNCTANKLVFASGRYFQPMFKKPFIPMGKKDYTDLEGKTKKVDFLMQCSTYNYTDSDLINAKIVNFFFKEDFTMYTMIVPNGSSDRSSLRETARKLQDPNIFEKVFNSLEETQIKLIVPNYPSISSVTNNVDISKEQGILRSYFNAETSNIEDATCSSKKLYLAAAYSTVVISNTSTRDRGSSDDDECTDNTNGEMIEFIVDRPMIYFTSVLGAINTCGVGNIV